MTNDIATNNTVTDDTVTNDTATETPLVTADKSLCCGSGMCVLTAPGIFTQNDEDATVEVLVPHPDPSRMRDVREAVVSCPTSAIRLAE